MNSRKIPAGTIRLVGDRKTEEINVTDGADAIMTALERVGNLMDATGEEGTNVGGLPSSIKQSMAELTEQRTEDMRIFGNPGGRHLCRYEGGRGLWPVSTQWKTS